MKRTVRRPRVVKPAKKFKPPGSKSAAPPPPPPIRSGLPPADLSMLYESYHEQADATLREGLRRAIEMSKELAAGGALTSYIETRQQAAVGAIRAFADVDPFDTRAVVELQRAIRDYLEPMDYLVDTFAPYSRLARMEDMEDIEDADLQSRPLGVDDETTPRERDSDINDA